MTILGLLLVLAGLAAVAVALLRGGQTVVLSWHQHQISTNLFAIFLAGAVTLFLLEGGGLLIQRGSVRRLARWRELQLLRRRDRELQHLRRSQQRERAAADAEAEARGPVGRN